MTYPPQLSRAGQAPAREQLTPREQRRREKEALRSGPLQARIGSGAALAATTVIIVALTGWGAWHVVSLSHEVRGEGHDLAFAFAATFALVAWQLSFGYLERPRRATPRQQAQLDKLRIVVAVPVYNEDDDALLGGLRSLLYQTRRPSEIFVVDDGSTVGDYTAVRQRFGWEADQLGQRWRWVRQENGGKRMAQARVFSATVGEADAYLTVDSDGILDPHALEELVKPMADPLVTSVAGIVLATNNKQTLLARFTDVWFVTSQLVARSALSLMGSVLVNSGPIALYRAEVIHAYMHSYIQEEFANRHVSFSDDSMLTLYAKLWHDGKARTVQQCSAFAFSLMPFKFNNHRRQYTRWMRGSTIRSLWRFRYLPVTGYAYWAHLANWTQVFMSLAVTSAVVLTHGTGTALTLLPVMIGVPIVLGYAQALKYLTIWRSDESRWDRFLNWSTMPIAVLWSMTVLRFLRWYGIATCWKTGWGTRQTVEVRMADAA